MDWHRAGKFAMAVVVTACFTGVLFLGLGGTSGPTPVTRPSAEVAGAAEGPVTQFIQPRPESAPRGESPEELVERLWTEGEMPDVVYHVLTGGASECDCEQNEQLECVDELLPNPDSGHPPPDAPGNSGPAM